MEHDLV